MDLPGLAVVLPCYYLIIDPSFCEIGVCSGGAEMRIPRSVNGTQRSKYLHEKKVALPNIVTWQVVLERRRFCQATLVVVMGEFRRGGKGEVASNKGRQMQQHDFPM